MREDMNGGWIVVTVRNVKMTVIYGTIRKIKKDVYLAMTSIKLMTAYFGRNRIPVFAARAMEMDVR